MNRYNKWLKLHLLHIIHSRIEKITTKVREQTMNPMSIDFIVFSRTHKISNISGRETHSFGCPKIFTPCYVLFTQDTYV